MLLDELLVTLRAVDAHAEEFRLGLKLAPGVPQLASLSCDPECRP